MAVERRYLCNLCRDQIPQDHINGFKGVGLHWTGQEGWIQKSWRDTENHLCLKCISSIQATPKICGQGYQCDGGMNCQGDHK